MMMISHSLQLLVLHIVGKKLAELEIPSVAAASTGHCTAPLTASMTTSRLPAATAAASCLRGEGLLTRPQPPQAAVSSSSTVIEEAAGYRNNIHHEAPSNVTEARNVSSLAAAMSSRPGEDVVMCNMVVPDHSSDPGAVDEDKAARSSGREGLAVLRVMEGTIISTADEFPSGHKRQKKATGATADTAELYRSVAGSSLLLQMNHVEERVAGAQETGSAVQLIAPSCETDGLATNTLSEQSVHQGELEAGLKLYPPGSIGDGEFDFRPFFLWRDRLELYDRIGERCEEMVSPSFKGIGVRG
jgi:hypothetical protein